MPEAEGYKVIRRLWGYLRSRCPSNSRGGINDTTRISGTDIATTSHTAAEQVTYAQPQQHETQPLNQPAQGDLAPAPPTHHELSRTGTLPDGRSIFWQEWGNLGDPGTTLLYLHGTPANPDEGSHFLQIVRDEGIRLIAPCRPGTTGSDLWAPELLARKDFRVVRAYVEDVAWLVCHLRLGRFGILGLSGGGAFALACAHGLQRSIDLLLPDTRARPLLAAVGLYSSAIPASVPGRESLPLQKRYRWFVGDVLPSPVDHSSDQRRGPPHTLFSHLNARLWHAVYAWVPAYSRQAYFLEMPQMFGARADWGFELEEIDFDGVRIWAGARDPMCPARRARVMAERVRGAVYREFEGEYHNFSQSREAEVLGGMVRVMREKREREMEMERGRQSGHPILRRRTGSVTRAKL